ncbi:coproporphyrinogen III oxidase [Pedobacter westerhofensis]|uniref:coproporphyrinogen III oxidase n=1 Tax=Pedobacter westerhofensis TaxID=425512 RepID=UPI00115A302A|nr:coproporphyrinogen III oxidase [Pedobacter westerhofensis]
MKKAFLSLVFAGSMLLAASACNSTKNVSGSSDSTATDTAAVTTPPTDTAMKDTSKTMPPDTTKTPKM